MVPGIRQFVNVQDFPFLVDIRRKAVGPDTRHRRSTVVADCQLPLTRNLPAHPATRPSKLSTNGMREEKGITMRALVPSHLCTRAAEQKICTSTATLLCSVHSQCSLQRDRHQHTIHSKTNTAIIAVQTNLPDVCSYCQLGIGRGQSRRSVCMDRLARPPDFSIATNHRGA